VVLRPRAAVKVRAAAVALRTSLKALALRPRTALLALALRPWTALVALALRTRGALVALTLRPRPALVAVARTLVAALPMPARPVPALALAPFALPGTTHLLPGTTRLLAARTRAFEAPALVAPRVLALGAAPGLMVAPGAATLSEWPRPTAAAPRTMLGRGAARATTAVVMRRFHCAEGYRRADTGCTAGARRFPRHPTLSV
jgi:hypothetical protein